MSMIYGGRVRLRATERDNLKHYYEWFNDPEHFTLGVAGPPGGWDEPGKEGERN